MEIMEGAEEHKEEEKEQIPDECQLPVEDEMHSRRSPLSHSPPDVRDTFLNQQSVPGAIKEMQRLWICWFQ